MIQDAKGLEQFTVKELEKVVELLQAATPDENLPEKFAKKAEIAAYLEKRLAETENVVLKIAETDTDLLAIEAAAVGMMLIMDTKVATERAKVMAEKQPQQPATPPADPTPAPKSAPVDPQSNEWYLNDLVLGKRNVLVNGRLYVEIRTSVAVYTLTPEEAAIGLKTK